MSIQIWHPFRDFEQVRGDMDRMWDDLFPTSRRAVTGTPFIRTATGLGPNAPAIDLLDNGDGFVLRANMPGVKKEDIDISLDNEADISIKGETHEEHKEKNENFFYSERSSASYSRTLTLPCKVDEKGIKAALKNGVLTIHLPKLKDKGDKKVKVEVS